MTRVAGLKERLRALLHRDALERELDREIRLHLELETEQNLRAGMPPEEAARRARLAFGGIEDVRETHRDARGTRWLEDAAADLRFGLRALRRNPVLAATAILTLALGIGANAAIFSVVNAVILRPLPFPEPGRLVRVSEDNPEKGWHRNVAAPANYLDWAEQTRAFQGMAAFTPGGHATLSGEGEAVMLHASEVTGNFFTVLGIPAVRGRVLRDDETWGRPTHVAVISDRLWRARFAGRQDIVGRTVRLDDVPTQVVGVVPARYRFPAADVDVWRPMEWNQSSRGQTWFRRAHWLGVVGRLAPGADDASADADLQRVVRRLQQQYPETNRFMGADLVPLHDYLIGGARTPLLVLLAAVAVLLLIACANVGNLLLVQALGRRRESALRLALGAGRGRLIRQALTESLLLSCVGGLAGAALGWAGTRLLAAFQPAGLVPVRDVGVDWRVLVYVFAVIAASGILFGIAPAVWHGRQVPADALKEGERGSSGGGALRRWGHGLAVAEVALALLLTLGAGLLVRSFRRLEQVDPGFDPRNVLTVGLNLPATRYDSAAKAIAFFRELETQVRALPGVTGAALVLLPPLATGGWTSDYSVAGRPAGTYGTEVSHRQVSPGYFAVMRVPLLRGRFLTDADREGAPPVVVINEAMAREAFAGQDPIGQRLAFDKLPDSTSRWWTIVGVVGSERQASLAAPPATEAFQPYTQEANSYMTLVARTTGDPSGIVPAVRRVLAGLDPDLAPATLNTMEHLRASALATQRFLMFLLTAFAAVGLVLALVGVYGVIAQLARRRTREMGIRLALGASRAKLQWLVVRQGLGLALGGVAAGTGAALIATRLMRSLLYGVSSTDPATFFAVPLLLLGCALAATWLPAARASRVDPALTLREE